MRSTRVPENDSPEKALSANSLDRRKPLRPFGESLFDPLPEPRCPFGQSVHGQEAQHFQGRSAGQWVRDKGAGVECLTALAPAGHELAGSSHGGQGEPAPQGLAATEQVGKDTLSLDGEPAAGAAEPRHHLVGDQEDAMVVTEMTERREPTGRWNNHPLSADDGFDHDTGGVLVFAEPTPQLLFRRGER